MAPLMLSRRGLITGLAAMIAAPAIVRAGSLMPVKAEKLVGFTIYTTVMVPRMYALIGRELIAFNRDGTSCRVTKHGVFHGIETRWEGVRIIEGVPPVSVHNPDVSLPTVSQGD